VVVVRRWRRAQRPRVCRRAVVAQRAELRTWPAGADVLKSRDMRGIGRSPKITREASSPMNPGVVGRAMWRSVKPSAQLTLVRTQHLTENTPQYMEKSDLAHV
jgi:hypothetical protein